MVTKFTLFLALARKIIPRKATLPILTHICFDDGKVMASDLNNTLVMKTDLSQSFTIAFELLNKIMKQKPQSLEFTTEGERVQLQYDNRKVTFTSLDVEDFPELQENVNERLDTWDQDIIKLFNSQSAYVSHDELKPVLNGVFIKSNGSIETCATDGHVLRLIKSESKRENNYNLLLRPDTLDMILQGSRGGVEVFESNENYRFVINNGLELFSRKIDSAYPDYENVIPKKLDDEVTFRYVDFLNLIKASKPFTNKETHLVELTCEDNQLSLSVIDEDVSWKGFIPLLSDEVSPCRFGFDAAYLEKLLSGVCGDTITWCHNGPESASLFSGNTDAINLIMPVRLARRSDNEDGLKDKEYSNE